MATISRTGEMMGKVEASWGVAMEVRKIFYVVRVTGYRSIWIEF